MGANEDYPAGLWGTFNEIQSRLDMTSVKFVVDIKRQTVAPDDGQCEPWNPKHERQSMAGQEEVHGHPGTRYNLCRNSRRKESFGKVS